MLAKLRLDQTATYEQAIAAYEISKMICAFVEGRQHILCIGAEQGDIPGWDDFVIQDRINAFTHLQIKRQQTDFAPEGNCIKNGNQELTPLDKSILSLGGWMATYNPSVNTNSYRFKLCLPHVGPDIKRDFGLRNLRDFMNLHINSTTTTQGLLNLYNTGDTVAVNIYNWLTKWCSFIDWEHIRKVLCVLEIIDYGTETDINTACIAELARVFKEPNDMLLHIKAYTQQNSAYTGSISPRQLLYQLNDYLLDSQKTWTQIDNVNGNWRISGIHDLETNTEVERPSKVIPKLWENNRNRALHINVSPINQVLDPIHERIFHLAIHLQGNVNGLCVNWDGWKVCVESKLGGTLGDKEDDLDNLTISNNNAPYNAIDGRSMNSNAEREEFANEMIAEMTKVTWSLVTQKVSWRISNMNITQSQELRDAVETRWNGWQPILGADIPALTLLLKKMMHPNAEGQEVLGHLRVGPKTKSLIADALFTCLLVSVALDQANAGVMRTADGLSVGAIGLNWWSGPAGKTRKVRKIDEQESIDDLIGKESSDILIISQSEHPENEVYKQPLAESKNVNHSLAAGHKPKLLITRNRLFNSIINKGSISDLRSYLQQKLTVSQNSLTETLNSNVL